MPPPPPPTNVYPCLDWIPFSETENLIIAGHVEKNVSSIEVYLYDNEQNDFYLHHDIIQSDYPCCLKWVGSSTNHLSQSRLTTQNQQPTTRNIAAAGYMNPDIYLWDIDVNENSRDGINSNIINPLKVLKGHKDAVIDINWNNQVKNIIASGSADKHIRLWNLDECKSISNIKLPGKVSALEFGIHEHFSLLAGDLNANVSLIDTRTGTITDKWKLTGEVERVRWIPIDHSKFLVSDDQGYIYYFDTRFMQNNSPIIKFRAHEISVTGLCFSPKCMDMLVTASADGTIKVWDTKLAFRCSKTTGIEPSIIKEVKDLKIGSILSLGICPNSLSKIAVGGESNCNSFRTYDLTDCHLENFLNKTS